MPFVDVTNPDHGTVVVLGSNSFSGSDFVDLLLSQTRHRVVGISRSAEPDPAFLPYRIHPERHRFQFVRLDLNRDLPEIQALLDALRPAFVINFAAQSEVAPSWEQPAQWMQTNVVSTTALADFLRRRDWLRRYVHISTPEVYGHCSGLVDEDAPFQPSTPYAASRAAAELSLRTFIREFDLPCVFVRSANVYGAHQQLYKLLPRAAILLRLGRKIALHGGGTQQRSFVHIRDVSRGTLQVLRHGRPGRAYHFATDRLDRIADIVATLCAARGLDFDQRTEVVPARPGNDQAYHLDCRRAQAEFGWRAQVSLADGVREVIGWVDDEWERIRSLPLEYVHRP